MAMEDPEGAWSPRPQYVGASPSRRTSQSVSPAKERLSKVNSVVPTQTPNRSVGKRFSQTPPKSKTGTIGVIPFDQKAENQTHPTPTSRIAPPPPPPRGPLLETTRVSSTETKPFDEAMEEGMTPLPRKTLGASPKHTPMDWSPNRKPRSYPNEFDSRFHIPPARIVEPRLDKVSRESLRLPPNPEPRGNEDDDSLFDFRDKKKKSSYAEVNKSTSGLKKGRRKGVPLPEEDDDTSVEAYGNIAPPPTTIQERTQAAWDRKRRTAANNGSSANEAPGPRENSHGVSFENHETIHRYPNDMNDSMENENSTLAGHSLNSEYTKSMESEVEDAIKDLFMIGSSKGKNPGRRKLKHNPNVKERLRARAETEAKERETRNEEAPLANDQSTIGTYESDGNTQTDGSLTEGDEGEGPLLGAWSMMESSLSAVGAALGLNEESKEMGAPLPCTTETTRSGSGCTPARVSPVEEDPRTSFQGIIDYVMGATSPTSSRTPILNPIDPIIAAPSLEEDTRLMELAAQAAASWHELQGYVLDPNYEMNIVGDIKFSVVDLALPLGLVFQENDGGCWVTQLLTDGHAAKSGGVVVGDQLAAVDGKSTVRFKVHEVATLVRSKSNQATLELTFLRYVGPLRPAAGAIREEGYEVNATEPEPLPAISSRSKSRRLKNSGSKEAPGAKSTAQRKGAKKRTAPVKKKKADAPGTEKKKFRLFGRRK